MAHRCGMVCFIAEAHSTPLPSDERRLFKDLGIRVVIDVRTPAEVKPTAWRQTTVVGWQIPLISDERLGKQPMATADSAELAAAYLNDLVRGASAVQQIVLILAEQLSARNPCIVHCAAGRDRTGSIVALLLASIGVRDDEVATDYARSNLYAHHTHIALSENPLYANSHLAGQAPLEVREETILMLLAMIREAYGSPAQFLAECGIGPSILCRIEDAVVQKSCR